jgi:hypothetical protein
LYAGKPVTRRALGLPDDWSRVKKWLNNTVYCFRASQQIIPERVKKCPEVPTLQNYNVPPPKEFWLSFPKNGLPKTPKTCVNVPVLEEKIRQVQHSLTWAQLRRAEKCVDSLMTGGGAGQRFPLPPCYQKNAQSTVKFGEEVVDTVASWVKKGFVAGPFDYPPLPQFRVNPLMAVDQVEKVRLVLNVSAPKGSSFNDNVVQEGIE